MGAERPPRMDALLASPDGQVLISRFGRPAVRSALREALGVLKSGWRRGAPPPDPAAVLADAKARLSARFSPPLERVINATGVVLHTNLGRAPLPKEILDAAAQVLSGYVDLELDLSTGERGHRDTHTTKVFQDLLGTAHEAVVVNNNAAAVLLLLKALSAGRETVVSRGELVEIGGGFRVPDVMEASGALLREVGTTNRTRPEDYARAVGPNTALLLKVHPSNFRVVGFSREVSPAELVAVGRAASVPTAYDLGSGLLLPEGDLPLGDEEGVRDALASGLDAICFSADKLLGGCQAGVLLLRPDLAARVRHEPLLRAIRADKYTYALLGATLDLYRAGRWRQIPALRMLAASEEDLLRKARSLGRRLKKAGPGLTVELVRAEGRVGGGAAPLHGLPSPALAVLPAKGSAVELERFLRGGRPAILGVLSGGRVILHVRTLLEGEDSALVARIRDWAQRGD